MLRGKLLRKPIVKIGGANIEYVTKHTYLGIVLDEKLSFNQHLEQVSKKTTAVFYKIRRVVRASWGFDSKALTTLYKGLGEALLLYGAAVWAHKISLSTYAEISLRSQRLMLLTVCRGYRTVSRDALQVLAGVLPTDLRARERKDLYLDKKVGGHRKKQIKDYYIGMWQERWSSSEKGRVLYQMMPA